VIWTRCLEGGCELYGWVIETGLQHPESRRTCTSVSKQLLALFRPLRNNPTQTTANKLPHQFLFLNDRPPAAAVGTGGTFSFFAATPFLAASALVVAAAPFFAPPAAGFALPAPFVTMVVPAEVLLASELRPVSFSLAVPYPNPAVAAAPRFACVRLAVRFPMAGAGGGLIGLAGRIVGFSGGAPDGLKGERGRVRELWDLGERTVEGTTLREAVRDAFALVIVVAVLARFFGLGRSC
jgi:hypothetical protein